MVGLVVNCLKRESWIHSSSLSLFLLLLLLSFVRFLAYKQPGFSTCVSVVSNSPPLAPCNRSIDSNRALKFPLPNPPQPGISITSPLHFLWIISTKMVGRSKRGLVKIWRRIPSSSKSTKMPFSFTPIMYQRVKGE